MAAFPTNTYRFEELLNGYILVTSQSGLKVLYERNGKSRSPDYFGLGHEVARRYGNDGDFLSAGLAAFGHGGL